MIVLISGSDRPGSNTLRVARLLEAMLVEAGEDVRLIDLGEHSATLFHPASYAEPPAEMIPLQEAILAAVGVLTVVPEYNGSFPGALKYFIDLLRFPESLVGVPAAFVGLSAGSGGGVRAVEHLEMVFHYRAAHLYGRRVFLRGIHRLLDSSGRLVDPELEERLRSLALGFSRFCRQVGARHT